MKILYPNLKILNTWCNGKDNKKEQRGCLSIAVSSKKNGRVKWRENNVKDTIEFPMPIDAFM